MTYSRFNHFKWLYLISLIIVALFVLVRTGAENRPIIANDVEDIYFSAESGFYEEAFDLRIAAVGGTVYYTLDGSEPTCHSLRYDGPIHISDASPNENVYAMITDTSPGFLVDMVKKSGATVPGYRVPSFPIDKCTIVRAVIHYGEGRYSNVKTASYFVGFDGKSGYDGMNVVSIVTNPDNLFGYDNGIYVLGRMFTEEMDNRSEEDTLSPYWWWWIGNYSQRGREAERVASVQFFNAEGNLLLSQNCGIRIHGGGSRGYNPKSLNLYSREEYSGKDYFPYDFFGSGYLAHKMTLTQGGDDYQTKLRDYLMNTLVADSNVATMDFVPCVLFLDGEYWGVYWLTEKYDKDYVSFHYTVDAENVVMIKNGILEEGDPKDQQLYNDMINFFTTEDMADDEKYRLGCELIDIDSFIDYYASMTYISRFSDWPLSNFALWRTRKVGTSKFDDGKWRWMVFDVNSGGLWEEMADFDSIGNAMSCSQMFDNLMRNDEFRGRFTDRVAQLGETTFSEKNVDRLIADFRKLLDAPMQKNQERFYDEDLHDQYDRGVASIAAFLSKRREIMPTILEKYR